MDQVGNRSGIRELLTSPSWEGNSGFSLTWASEGPHGVNPPIPEEACVQDRHPRDRPRDQPTNAQDEDNQGSANPRRKSRSPPTLTDLRTRTFLAEANRPPVSPHDGALFDLFPQLRALVSFLSAPIVASVLTSLLHLFDLDLGHSI
ncbi:hypothetical protein GW17_00058778 [Ensete ventricosum]|nr:hypothetical protein GW17_00058778 [Ensete ventricosum]